MLITRHGLRMFSDYDLDGNLRNFLTKLQATIEADRRVIDSEEEGYIKDKIQQHTISPIILHLDKISVSQKEYPISSEYFPSNFDTDRGRSYPKPVLTFRLPFSGNADWFKCRPPTFMLWSEEVSIENNEIIFEVINFSNNAEAVKKERDDFTTRLQEQVGNINKALESYNSKIENVVRETIRKTKAKFKEQDDVLSQLGNNVR